MATVIPLLRRPSARLAALLALLVALRLVVGAHDAAAHPAATVPLPPVERWGVAVLSDGDVLYFTHPFVGTPVVLVSAQVNGEAVAAAAVDPDPHRFRLSLRDRDGNPVRSAWVQWVAVAPDPAIGLLGGTGQGGDGGRINFTTPFANPPIVVTNASTDGRTLVSGVSSHDAIGFTLSVRDVDGRSVPFAAVTWLAVDPGISNGFATGEAPGTDGADVAVAPPFRSGPAYVLSASPAMPAGAVDNRLDGFRLSLAPPGPAPETPPTVQWLGYAGPAGGDTETSAVTPGARLIVRARWPTEAMPEPTLPVCFSLSSNPEGSHPFARSCGSAGAPAVAFRVPFLASGSRIWVSVESTPGWAPAGQNPAPFDVPAPSKSGEITFALIPGGSGGDLVVRARDADGNDLVGACWSVARVDPASDAPGDAKPVCDAAMDGAARLTGLLPGAYLVNVLADPPGYRVDPTPARVVVPGSGAAEVVVGATRTTGRAGGVRVLVASRDGGLPVPGACFDLWSAAPDGTPDRRIASQCDAEDNRGDDGAVLFTGVTAGRYLLAETTVPPGTERVATRPLVVPPDAITEVMVSLDPASSRNRAIVQTTDPDGAPVIGACVTVTVADRPDRSYLACDDRDGTPDGTTPVDGLPAGSYVARQVATPVGFAPAGDQQFDVPRDRVPYAINVQMVVQPQEDGS